MKENDNVNVVLTSNELAEIHRLYTLIDENLHQGGEEEGGYSLEELCEDVLNIFGTILDTQ